MSESAKRNRPLTLRAIWLMVSLSFQADAKSATLLCLAMPAYYLAPATGALAAKAVVDSAVAGQVSMAVVAGLFAALTVVITAGSLKAEVYLSYTLEKKVEALVQRRLAEMLVRLPGIEHYERPDHLDEVQQLRDRSGELGSGLLAAMNIFGQVCQVLVVCALLATRSPWLLLLPLLAVPSFVATGISNRLTRRAAEQTAEPERLLHRLVGLVAEPSVAREARLFGLKDELRQRRRRLAGVVDRTQGRAQAKSTGLALIGDLIFSAGYLGAVVLVLQGALSGRLTAGDVALTIVLAGQAQGFINGLVNGAKFFAGIYIVAARFDWLKAYERTQLPAAGVPAAPVPHEMTRGIDLEGLTFRYPGTSRTVLEDVSFRLEPGSVVALVGENGAGKSSLVKLLLRYYQPTSGRITVDGNDLAGVDVDDWRARVSGAFQDYCNLEFVVRESVGLGSVEHVTDEEQVREALGHGHGHATSIVDGLPDKLETQLGSSWEGGVDLSGGEWQRIALSRAGMRTAPLLTVFDEPTAALDAHAEHELFQSFAAATRETRRQGGITVFVTHRFSTVRMADLILVLDEGRLRESGNHEELMRNGDLYAELFELQAAAYQPTSR